MKRPTTKSDRTVTMLVDGDYFVATLESGGIRVGLVGLGSVDWPAGHVFHEQASRLTSDTVAAFYARHVAPEHYGWQIRAYKLHRTWREYAKEPIRVEEIGGTFYAFGSELACLRLYHRYRYDPKLTERYRVEYSKTYNSWFFRMEVSSEEIVKAGAA